MQQRIHQCAVCDSRAPRERPCHGFVHHHKIIIFAEQLQRNFFGRGFESRARQDLDVDYIARGHPLCAPREALSDAYTAIIDQLLNARAAQFGQAGSEIKVEPSPGIFG